jgi:predicted esterase
MKLLRLGEVDALYYYQGSWQNSLPLMPEQSNLTAIVLFHGYGANAQDLGSISQYYDQKNNFKASSLLWIFPQGPLNLSGGYGDFSQRAWFPISVERLMMQSQAGPDFMSQQTIEGADQLFSNLERYFNLLNDHGLKNMVLGGFSQGGMVAYHVLPRIVKKFSINVLALFSTVSIDFNRYHQLWKQQVSFQSLANLIQSHGRSDQILSYQESKNLHEYLRPYFQRSDFIEFFDGHTIPENVLAKFFKLIEIL